jgi:hypothetical protein
VKFASSASISSGSSFTSPLYINAYGNNDANWPAGTTGYVGIRVPNGGDVNYGWAQISYNSDKSLTIHDFAYEQTINTAISAGAIPEPSAYAALAGLLAGSAALYRRRQQKRAAATDHSG